MELIKQFIHFILHLDQNLITFVSLYGSWTYAILFLIIFSETGLVFTAFLPGDSLLFASGALSSHAESSLNINLLFMLLTLASLLGNQLNFSIGKWLGPKVFHSHHSLFLNKKHLHKAHQFYLLHGGKTLIMARFIPIMRSFAPFVAGIGNMQQGQFFLYNVIGGVLWVGGLLYASFSFGNIPLVKNHFSFIVIAIIMISLLPAILGLSRKLVLRPSR